MPNQLKYAARAVFMQKMGAALNQYGITDAGVRVSSDEITAGVGVSPGPGGAVSTVFSNMESLLRTKLAQQPVGTQSVVLTRTEALRALESTIKTLADKTAGTVDKEIKSQIIDHVESPVALSPLEEKQVKVLASRGLVLAKGILSKMALLPVPAVMPTALPPPTGVFAPPAAVPGAARAAFAAAQVVATIAKQAATVAAAPPVVVESVAKKVAVIVKQASEQAAAVPTMAEKIAETAAKMTAMMVGEVAPSAAEKVAVAAKAAVEEAAVIAVSVPNEKLARLTNDLRLAKANVANLKEGIRRGPAYVTRAGKLALPAAVARVQGLTAQLAVMRAAGDMGGLGAATSFWGRLGEKLAEGEFPLSGKLSESVKLAEGKVFTSRLENELDKIATSVTPKIRNISLYNILNKLEKQGYLSVTKKSPTGFETKVLKFPKGVLPGVPLSESLKASAAKEVKRRVENIARVKAAKMFPVPEHVKKLLSRISAKHKAPPRVMRSVETESFTTYPEVDWDFPALGQEVEAGAEAFGQEVEAGAEAFGQEVEAGAEAFGQEVEAGAEAFGGIGIEEKPFVDGF